MIPGRERDGKSSLVVFPASSIQRVENHCSGISGHGNRIRPTSVVATVHLNGITMQSFGLGGELATSTATNQERQ